MASLQLGNESVIEVRKVDDGLAATSVSSSDPRAVEESNIVRLHRKDLGNQVTTLSIPDTYLALEKDGSHTPQWALDDQIKTIKHFVSLHFADKPAWVDGDNDLLVQVVANMYDCRISRPEDWEIGYGAK